MDNPDLSRTLLIWSANAMAHARGVTGWLRWPALQRFGEDVIGDP